MWTNPIPGAPGEPMEGEGFICRVELLRTVLLLGSNWYLAVARTRNFCHTLVCFFQSEGSSAWRVDSAALAVLSLCFS